MLVEISPLVCYLVGFVVIKSLGKSMMSNNVLLVTIGEIPKTSNIRGQCKARRQICLESNGYLTKKRIGRSEKLISNLNLEK